MDILITEKQLKKIIKSKKEVKEDDTGPDPQPKAGTSSQQSGGQGYPQVNKWESGVTRGPANQVGVTKWADIVGSSLKRSKANQLKEQKFGMTYSPETAKSINYGFNPSNDTPTKKYSTFWGTEMEIPTDGSVSVYLWTDDKPRGLQFKGAYGDGDYIFWPRKKVDPNTKQVVDVPELAPDEEWLKSKFPTNSIRSIRTKKDNRHYGPILRKNITTKTNIYGYTQSVDDEWNVQPAYYAQVGDKYYAYKPEDYIHTTITTKTIEFVKENWPVIAEVTLSIAAGVLTGGQSFVVQALIQGGIGATFAAGMYLSSEKTQSDKIGFGVGLAIACLPFIPAAFNIGVRGPIKSLSKYGNELSGANTPEEVLSIINKFDEADKIMVTRCLTQIPKAEFEKVIRDRALRGLAEQVKNGQVVISKIPGSQLRWWKELLVEGGGAIPIVVAGYTYESIQKRKEDERIIMEFLGELLKLSPEKPDTTKNVSKPKFPGT